MVTWRLWAACWKTLLLMTTEHTINPPQVPAGPAPASAGRRGLLLAAAGLAGAAGAGLAWWRYQPHGAAGDPVPEGFWGLSLKTPEGAALDVARFQGKPLLLNFWATWCPPCVEELPLLDVFFRENSAKGWWVLGVAVDRVEAVQTFLRKTPVTFPVAMAGLGGADLGRAFGNQAGGLPFSVVLGADGSVAHRKMGQITHQDLAAWVAAGSA